MKFSSPSALALSALLSIGLLSACQDQSAKNTDSTSQSASTSTDTKTDAGTDAGAANTDSNTDVNAEANADSNKDANAEAPKATTPAVTEAGAIPTGYTEVAPLTQEPVREFSQRPERSLQEGSDYYALLDTARGQVLVDLLEEEVPVTVNNFVFLARNHFYDGTRFHRVIDGFMAQAGDPTSADTSKKDAWGTGGPGYQFGDEIRQDLTFSEPNLLAMANSGPGTNGSQFFITFAPTEFLNGAHTIFGRVADGQAALDALTRTADTSTGSETPVEGAEADTLISVRILTKNK